MIFPAFSVKILRVPQNDVREMNDVEYALLRSGDEVVISSFNERSCKQHSFCVIIVVCGLGEKVLRLAAKFSLLGPRSGAETAESAAPDLGPVRLIDSLS